MAPKGWGGEGSGLGVDCGWFCALDRSWGWRRSLRRRRKMEEAVNAVALLED